MRVNCYSQEQNTVSLARTQTRTVRSRDERANHEATAPPILELYTTLATQHNRNELPTDLGYIVLKIKHLSSCKLPASNIAAKHTKK